MQEVILAILQFGLMASTIDLMFVQGMNIPISYLSFFKERPTLLLRSLLAVIVLVPIAALFVIFLVRPSQDVSVGLAILAACPAAPMMLVNIPKAGGEPRFVTSLHLSLGLLSLITTPVILELMADALNFRASISPLAIAGQVSVSLIIPVCIGILFYAKFPGVTDIIRKPLAIIGQIISFLMIGIILLTNYHFLLQMDLRSYIAMALMVIIALGIGNFLAPPQPEERTAMALESAARHPGLAFLIASLNFPLEKALPVLIPYLFIFAIISILYVQFKKKMTHFISLRA